MNKRTAENLMSLLKKASDVRASLFTDKSTTNCYRLFDGKADGLEDLQIDDFNGRWLAQSPDPSHIALLDTLKGLTPCLYFKLLSQTNKDSPKHLLGAVQNERFEVLENGLRFWIDFQSGYSQGLFLDQRNNRKWVLENARNQDILNLFSYTCGFSVAAAKGGGRTTSVDLSKHYLNWGRDNFALNSLSLEQQTFFADDYLSVIGRLQKKQKLFDGIILDPPSFSRNKQGKVMSLEKDLLKMVQASSSLLKGSGSWSLISCNLRKLTFRDFEQICREGFYPHHIQFEKLTMPKDFRDKAYLHACRIKLL